MARFYLDGNVSLLLAVLLRALGHGSVTTAELGDKGATDVRQLTLAMRLQRAVLTHDLSHFEMLHEAWQTWTREWNLEIPPLHPGILLVPAPPRLTIDEAAHVVDELIARPESVENRLWVWSRVGGWNAKTV